MRDNIIKWDIEEKKEDNSFFDNGVPLNPIFFKVNDIIIEDFKEKNPIFYEKRGVPFKYFCSTLNKQIVLFEQEGVVNWCGYAQDYLIHMNEQNKLETGYKKFVKVKNE